MRRPQVRRAVSLVAAALLIVLAVGPVGASSPPALPVGAITTSGIGASFPYPAYTSWFSKYKNTVSEASNDNFQYVPNGSGAGVSNAQSSNPTSTWSASDLPMTNSEITTMNSNNSFGPPIHVPTLLGAVVLGIKLNCTSSTITLTRANVGDMFSGAITMWNDARLRDNGRNAGLASCNVKVGVVRRADSSGTTANFTAFLHSCTTTYWSSHLSGPTKTYNWPVGIAAQRNGGVAQKVKQLNGRIGYMEYAYAKQASLKIARVQNGDGNNFVTASTSSVQAAAASTLSAQLSAHPDMRFDPVACAAGFNSYPITAYSYAMLFTNAPGNQSQAQVQELVAFFYWGLTTGQGYLSALGYAALPSAVATASINQLHQVKWGGNAVWP